MNCQVLLLLLGGVVTQVFTAPTATKPVEGGIISSPASHTAEVASDKSARKGKLIPIFNNSPVFQANGNPTELPNSGQLLKDFKSFPLPWSVLLQPLPGVSGGGIFNEDTAIPLIEAKHGNERLGYYFFNPFGNMDLGLANLFGFGRAQARDEGGVELNESPTGALTDAQKALLAYQLAMQSQRQPFYNYRPAAATPSVNFAGQAPQPFSSASPGSFNGFYQQALGNGHFRSPLFRPAVTPSAAVNPFSQYSVPYPIQPFRFYPTLQQQSPEVQIEKKPETGDEPRPEFPLFGNDETVVLSFTGSRDELSALEDVLTDHFEEQEKLKAEKSPISPTTADHSKTPTFTSQNSAVKKQESSPKLTPIPVRQPQASPNVGYNSQRVPQSQHQIRYQSAPQEGQSTGPLKQQQPITQSQQPQQRPQLQNFWRQQQLLKQRHQQQQQPVAPYHGRVSRNDKIQETNQ